MTEVFPPCGALRRVPLFRHSPLPDAPEMPPPLPAEKTRPLIRRSFVILSRYAQTGSGIMVTIKSGRSPYENKEKAAGCCKRGRLRCLRMLRFVRKRLIFPASSVKECMNCKSPPLILSQCVLTAALVASSSIFLAKSRSFSRSGENLK